MLGAQGPAQAEQDTGRPGRGGLPGLRRRGPQRPDDDLAGGDADQRRPGEYQGPPVVGTCVGPRLVDSQQRGDQHTDAADQAGERGGRARPAPGAAADGGGERLAHHQPRAAGGHECGAGRDQPGGGQAGPADPVRDVPRSVQQSHRDRPGRHSHHAPGRDRGDGRAGDQADEPDAVRAADPHQRQLGAPASRQLERGHRHHDQGEQQQRRRRGRAGVVRARCGRARGEHGGGHHDGDDDREQRRRGRRGRGRLGAGASGASGPAADQPPVGHPVVVVADVGDVGVVGGHDDDGARGRPRPAAGASPAPRWSRRARSWARRPAAPGACTTRARATATRCSCPPESSSTCRSPRSPMWSSLSAASALASASPALTPRARSATETFSRAERIGTRP